MKPWAAVLMLSLLASPAHAGLLGASKASQTVVGFVSSAASCVWTGGKVDTRVNPDGSTTPLVIPQGQVFVMTGLSWKTQSGTSGQRADVTLSLETPAAFLAGLFSDGDTVRSDGKAGHWVQIPNVVVKPGVTLCVSADGGSLSQAYVHGFFAKDK